MGEIPVSDELDKDFQRALDHDDELDEIKAKASQLKAKVPSQISLRDRFKSQVQTTNDGKIPAPGPQLMKDNWLTLRKRVFHPERGRHHANWSRGPRR